MISTTYNSEDLYVFWYPANRDGDGNVASTFAIPSLKGTGKSAREERRGLGESLRITEYAFNAILFEGEGVELSHALLDRVKERIAAPFWPLARPTAEFAALPIKGSINVTFETLSNGLGYPDFHAGFEIHAGDAPAGSFSELSWTAPLLLCDFAEAPDPSLITDELQDLTVAFVENAEVSETLTIAPQTFTDGPSLPDATVYKVFPFDHDFAYPAKSGGANRLMNKYKLGQSRRQYEDDQGAPANRNIGIRTYFDTIDEAAKLIAFFQSHLGMVVPFWLPAYLAETRLAANVSATDTDIEVEDASMVANHEWICILTRNGIAYRKIQSIGGNTLTLDTPIGIDVPYQDSSLCSLVLGRFDKRVIKILWDTDIDGSASIEFVETSPEYVPPAGETRGVTLGAKSVRGSIIEFEYNSQIWSFTTYEQDVSYNAGADTAFSINISHGKIARNITLENSVKIEAVEEECVPLKNLANHKIPYLDLRIIRADIANGVATNQIQKFTGKVMKPSGFGVITATAKFGGKKFDLLLPRQRHQRSCRYRTYGPGCDLAVSDWTFSAEFVDVGAEGWPHTFVINNITRDNAAALPDFFADWFAWGKVWVDDGSGLQTQFISSSSVVSSGDMTLTLAGDFDPYPANGATLKLVPECDRQACTCKAYHAVDNPLGKFDNFANFPGVNVAKGNLSLIKVSTDVGGGKKG